MTPIFLSHLSVPLLLFVVAQILLTKFQASVKRVRDNNRILTDTLQQRERELLISYNRQREMETESAAQAGAGPDLPRPARRHRLQAGHDAVQRARPRHRP